MENVPRITFIHQARRAVQKKPNFPWQDSFLAAILETDNTKLLHRMSAAERAIASRQRELEPKGPGTNGEWQALDKALADLQVLRRERVDTTTEVTCRICREPIPHEECKTDENGAAVHELCYVRELLAEAARAQGKNC